MSSTPDSRSSSNSRSTGSGSGSGSGGDTPRNDPFAPFGIFGSSSDSPSFNWNSRRGTGVDNNHLYEILGVDKTATIGDIKASFRKLARIHHPDKGGDECIFRNINEAYEILMDEKKRSLYDQYGLAGLENENENSNGSTTSTDIFEYFFGR